MEIQSRANKIIVAIIINVILLIFLYNVPVNFKILNNLCIFKFLTGKQCYNCGMTRAFLAILHFNFFEAYQYNKNVIIVFPLTVIVYLYVWIKYIFNSKGVKI